jgi:O-antigen ligase
MNRESLDKFCERGILGLVLAILVFTPLAFGGISQTPVGSSLDFILVAPFNIVQWMTVGVIALWAARLWATPRPKLLWPPICWAVLAFAAYAVIRYFTADIEYVARLEMIQVLVYTFLFLAIVNNLHRQESAQIITLTLVFLALAISAYAIYQFFTGSNKVWGLIKPYPKRGTGTFISPNNLSGFLEMILPLALACTLTSRIKAVSKVFTGYAAIVILFGIIVTVSRGSWFAVAIALLVFFAVLLFHHAHRLPALILLLVIVLGGAYFGTRNVFLRTRLSQIQTPAGALNDDGRFAIWRAAAKLWQENVWFGIGPGHFSYRFGKYRPAIIQVNPDRVHNDYLNTLTDFGIVGALLVAAAWIALYYCAIWTWRFVRGSPQTIGEHFSNKLTLVLGTSIGLLAILVHSFFDFNTHIPANAIVMVTLMAILTSYLRFATDRYWFTAQLWTKTLLSIALVAGLAWLSWQSARLGGESLWLMRAKKSDPASTAQIAALQKAFSIEPKNFQTARAIGEAYRLQSFQNTGDYEQQALEAMKWFKQATELNPYDDSSFLRYGICLDHIDKHDEAFAYFDKANRIEPSSYYNSAWMGWHYVQSGDCAAALVWLNRSKQLEWHDNPIADSYLQIAENQMLQAATNAAPFELQPTPAKEKFVPPPWNKN